MGKILEPFYVKLHGGLPYLVTKKQYGSQWRCHLRGEIDKEDRPVLQC